MEDLLISQDWINAGGLYLILIGVALLIAEFFIPSFGLFGFAGVAAALIGIIQLHQTGYIEKLPLNIYVMITFSTIGVFLSILGGWYSWKIYKIKNTTGAESVIGEEATVISWKNDEGRVHIQGEDWKAFSETPLSLKKNDIVTVSDIKNLKLKITVKS